MDRHQLKRLKNLKMEKQATEEARRCLTLDKDILREALEGKY